MTKARNPKELISKILKSRELSAVTFVRDYLQLQFDGPFINAYVWPRIRTEEKIVTPTARDYRDVLCAQIGKAVADIGENQEEMLFISFIDGTCVEISLKQGDRKSVEAAEFQDGTGQRWTVW